MRRLIVVPFLLASISALAQQRETGRSIVLPNPQLIHCRSAECSQLLRQDSGDGRAAYPAQVLTDFVDGEIVGLTAVYDKFVSIQELRSAIDSLYAKWKIESLQNATAGIWRVDSEKLVVQLADRGDGTKTVIYLSIAYGSHAPSAHIGPSAERDCGK
jgi:hypothetical protein